MLLAALRVYAGHHMFDGSVLARPVHRLKNEQDGPAILCIEHVLQSGQGLHADAQGFFCARFVFRLEITGVIGIDVFQTKPLAIGDAVRVSLFASFLNNLAEFHVDPF
jgi:hypothetical protein